MQIIHCDCFNFFIKLFFIANCQAHVICRSLGYPNATNFTVGSAFGSVNRTHSFYELECSGNETSLNECIHSDEGDCGEHEVAGVICLTEPTTTTTEQPTTSTSRPLGTIKSNNFELHVENISYQNYQYKFILQRPLTMGDYPNIAFH
jgi:hypothetical protein